MRLEEFEKYINENEEAAKKFDEMKKIKLAKLKDNAEVPGALAEAAAEIGIEIDATEFALDKILNTELSDEEMEAVSGGAQPKVCVATHNCFTIFDHPDEQDKKRACFSDWNCFGIHHHDWE